MVTWLQLQQANKCWMSAAGCRGQVATSSVEWPRGWEVVGGLAANPKVQAIPYPPPSRAPRCREWARDYTEGWGGETGSPNPNPRQNKMAPRNVRVRTPPSPYNKTLFVNLQ